MSIRKVIQETLSSSKGKQGFKQVHLIRSMSQGKKQHSVNTVNGFRLSCAFSSSSTLIKCSYFFDLAKSHCCSQEPL